MGVPTSVRREVAASGTASVFQIPAHSTVGIEPGAGGTMTVKVKIHPDSPLVDLDPDETSFSAAATKVIQGPVYEIQFAAATAAGFGSVAY